MWEWCIYTSVSHLVWTDKRRGLLGMNTTWYNQPFPSEFGLYQLPKTDTVCVRRMRRKPYFLYFHLNVSCKIQIKSQVRVKEQPLSHGHCENVTCVTLAGNQTVKCQKSAVTNNLSSDKGSDWWIHLSSGFLATLPHAQSVTLLTYGVPPHPLACPAAVGSVSDSWWSPDWTSSCLGGQQQHSQLHHPQSRAPGNWGEEKIYTLKHNFCIIAYHHNGKSLTIKSLPKYPISSLDDLNTKKD